MEKISPKNPVVYERYKSSCAWSLIRFCDFGQGDSNNRKLISHGKGLNSQVLSKYFIIKDRFLLFHKLLYKNGSHFY